MDMNESELAALVESERNERDQAARSGRAPSYPLYKSGPLIAVGTIHATGYHGYDDDGLCGAVRAAESGSRIDTLVHVAVRRVSADTDTIVAAFKGGDVIPLDEARRIAVNGYGGLTPMPARYQLVRTTPGGIERTQGPVSTVRAATVLAAHVLADNALVAKSEAQRFSVKLGNLPLGETATHESTGYKFRIERT
jgi:hypothetical protein